MMREGITVNGGELAVESWFPVLNPATGELFGEAPSCGERELDIVVDSAGEALTEWSQKSDDERCELLRQCAKAMRSQTVPLARLLTREQGKPIREAMNEVMGCAQAFRSTALLGLQPLSNEKEKFFVRRRPQGVVGAITPWNFPLILACWKIAPALRMGNSVVLKSSSHTPLSSLLMIRALNNVLPAGVLNMVSGGDELGEALVKHPAVHMITLTGSVDTGAKVMRAASVGMKQCLLELGGNDAAIVLEDCDIEKFSDSLFWSAFFNAGQFCTAVKRLFVHESIFRPLVDRLSEKSRSVKLGDGLEQGVEMGPLTFEGQRDRIVSLVDDARARGAIVEAGGCAIDRPGYFYAPTILTGLEDDWAIMKEEQFGPVLPIVSFQADQEAVERANRTVFGLGGSVWSSNAARASALAARLDVGMTWLNRHGVENSDAPLGGQKLSGLGYANGRLGLEAYCRYQTTYKACL
jgi:acyl-CoA reductase-like NAD-dependent aldehyde dehydrogenase